MKKKRLLAMLLSAVLMTGALTGCGDTGGQTSSDGSSKAESSASASEAEGSEEDAEPSGAEAPDVSEATDTEWDTSKEDTITLCVINNFYTAGEKKLAEEYMKLHPETKVVVDVIADNDSYMTKMMTSMEGDRKNAPDIVHGNFLAAATTGNMEVAVSKGFVYDMTDMLDEENPYNNGKVRDAFEEKDLQEAFDGSGGVCLGFLPFDRIGFALYYNKTILDGLSLEAPTTWEQLVDVCGKLKEAGYNVPLSAGPETYRMIATLSDAFYRGTMDTAAYLAQPGDAIWNEETMSANVDFAYDESNPMCDKYLVRSTERQLKYKTENSYDNETNRQILDTFYQVAQYFPDNWIAADSTQAITDFESQISPLLYQASFNAGLILSDTNALPDDMKFEWATTQIERFENPPEGAGEQLRGLWALGNAMSIVGTEDADHLARIKDFYKFWYSKDGAKMCFEETLNNGNFVQGPCIIKGVTLDPELEQLLAGFETVSCAGFEGFLGIGETYRSADKPLYYDYMNKFCKGEITSAEYLQGVDPLCKNYVQDMIETGGFDLDPTTPDEPKE